MKLTSVIGPRKSSESVPVPVSPACRPPRLPAQDPLLAALKQASTEPIPFGLLESVNAKLKSPVLVALRISGLVLIEKLVIRAVSSLVLVIE